MGRSHTRGCWVLGIALVGRALDGSHFNGRRDGRGFGKTGVGRARRCGRAAQSQSTKQQRRKFNKDGGRRIEGARTAVSLCWRLAKAAAAGEKLEVELSTEVRVRCEGLKAEGCVDCEGEVIMGCTHGGGMIGAVRLVLCGLRESGIRNQQSASEGVEIDVGREKKKTRCIWQGRTEGGRGSGKRERFGPTYVVLFTVTIRNSLAWPGSPGFGLASWGFGFQIHEAKAKALGLSGRGPQASSVNMSKG
ncbi:hypothetical protein C8R43DRAFT_961264 [Mycena crocata]|nr:hypothetical protein C8R43DRAFT_961264 [Mycena crocata]